MRKFITEYTHLVLSGEDESILLCGVDNTASFLFQDVRVRDYPRLIARDLISTEPYPLCSGCKLALYQLYQETSCPKPTTPKMEILACASGSKCLSQQSTV